jgi:hypothetical protein
MRDGDHPLFGAFPFQNRLRREEFDLGTGRRAAGSFGAPLCSQVSIVL